MKKLALSTFGSKKNNEFRSAALVCDADALVDSFRAVPLHEPEHVYLRTNVFQDLGSTTLNGGNLFSVIAAAVIRPESLRDLRWVLNRWTLAHLWYRIRLPIRRKRWRRESISAASRFGKQTGVRPTNGPAVAFGDFSGVYGLARAAIYDLEGLRAKHSHLYEIDIHDALDGVATGRRLFQGSVENVYFLCQPDRLKSVFAMIEPEQIAHSYRVGRWVWETPCFSEDWRFAEPLFHEIWAPSEFCAQTFRRALNVPVAVKPYPVPTPSAFAIQMRRRLGLSEDVFMGLAIMDITSCPARKNPWAHVLAWKQAFSDDRRAVLLLKVRVGKRTKLVLKELIDLIGNAQNILILTDDLSQSEVTELHRCANVFISLHRSEGYGLNIHEALALGTPVIATHYSANAEYGPSYTNYHGIGYDLIWYRDWTAHYSETIFKWADPHIDEAAIALKREFDAWTENSASVPRQTDQVRYLRPSSR